MYVREVGARGTDMLDALAQLFDTSDFPPRWHCGIWTPLHGWIHVIADAAIFGAYVAIPIALAFFVRRRTDLPFPKLFWLFSAFILFCGFSHLIEATIFWQPWYRFSALLKVGTAIVSWLTVAAMLPVIPQALRFRSPADLEAEVWKRTEQLADVNNMLHGKNEELEQFLYTVSHDLKSPLVTARGFLGELREDLQPIEDEGVRDAIQRIDGATARMAQLLEDLLELSRLGKVRNDPRWVDPLPIVEEVEKSLQKRPETSDVTVEVKGQLPAVFADPLRVTQVLDNLIQNAARYGTTNDNKIVFVEGETSAGGAVLRVIDRGIGVPEEMRERILLPFERLANDRSGTGVGLAIVTKIVAGYGGELTISETPGGGSTFEISFGNPDDGHDDGKEK